MSTKGISIASPARIWLLLAALLCLVWMTFAPAADFDLLSWDDDINLQNNPHLTGLSVASLKWMFTDFTYQWRYQPLAWLTWFSIFEVQGLNPFGYHLVNILFHLANTALVFLTGRHLLRNLKHGDAGALFAAGLWSLHPMRVEVVVWAVELLYQQALFFMLLSFLGYIRFADSDSPRKRNWLMFSAVAFGFSLFTFPLALGFVAVLVAMDVYWFKRLPEHPSTWLALKNRAVWLEKVPFILLTLLAASLNFICRANATKLFGAPASLEEFGIIPRVMQAFYIWAYYLWRPFWPTDLTPVPTRLIDFEPLGLVFVISAAIVAGGSWFVWRNRMRWPKLWVIWLAHLALLVPVLGLTEHPYFPNDRYSVVVWIGWSVVLAAGWALWRERVHRQVTPVAAALAMVTILAILSARQLPFWANNYSFFPHVIAQLKEHPFRVGLVVRLAQVHREARLRREAEGYLVDALEIQPDALALRTSLADLQVVLGKRAQAQDNYRLILKRAPKTAGIHARLARIYLDQGNHQAAADELAQELQIAPGNPVLELQYGLALARSGNLKAAASLFARMDQEGRLSLEDVFKCRLALADGYAVKGDLLRAAETAGEVKEQAEKAGVQAAVREAVVRLKRWVPIVLKDAPKE